MQKLNISHLDFSSLSEDVLKRGSSFIFRAEGNSMRPFILPGDMLTIEPISFSALQRGDIVFCRLPQNRIIVHRVIGRHRQPESDCLLIRGDGLYQETEYVTDAQVLGRIVQVVRESKVIHLTGAMYRMGVFFWVKAYPISPFLYFLPGRVLRKCIRLMHRSPSK